LVLREVVRQAARFDASSPLTTPCWRCFLFAARFLPVLRTSARGQLDLLELEERLDALHGVPHPRVALRGAQLPDDGLGGQPANRSRERPQSSAGEPGR
jgi:hypothetical protein